MAFYLLSLKPVCWALLMWGRGRGRRVYGYIFHRENAHVSVVVLIHRYYCCL